MSEETPASSREQRLSSLDLVKGIAIIGVVILHLALLQTHGPAPETNTGVGIMMFKGIPYSMLCMFIVVSGYFYKPGRSFAENVKKRIIKERLDLKSVI